MLSMVTQGRRLNVTSMEERGLLLGVITSHLEVLDAKDNDFRSSQMKASHWEEVTREFNTRSGIPRSRYQIQTLYKNMKAKAKKYQVRIMEAQRGTATFPEPDPISEMLLYYMAGKEQRRRIQAESAVMFAAGKCPVAPRPKQETTSDEEEGDENLSIIKPETVLETSFQETSVSNNVEIEFSPGADDRKINEEIQGQGNLQKMPFFFSPLINSSYPMFSLFPSLPSTPENGDSPGNTPEGVKEDDDEENERVMARREHLLRMKILSQEMDSREREHLAKMNVLELKKKVLKSRLKRLEEGCSCDLSNHSCSDVNELENEKTF